MVFIKLDLRKKKLKVMFKRMYPLLTIWAEREGRIEIGADYFSSSLLRIISEGGMIWEDNESKSIDEALYKGEQYLKNEFENSEFGYKIGE